MRDSKIDIIRAVCSLTVIIAHVSSPTWVNNIRTFDVVALVLISGMSIAKSKHQSYCIYVHNRIQKLLVPTYIMMLFVFAFSFVMCKILGMQQLYPVSKMVRSFFLLSKGSMGFVWIVRVYLMIAIVTPLLKALLPKIKKFCHLLFSILIFGEILFVLRIIGNMISIELINTIYFDYVYDTAAYSLVAFIGLWIANHSIEISKVIISTGVVFSVYQVIMIYFGNGFAPDGYKYPPQGYYLSYGILVAIILYYILPNATNQMVLWFSKNSFMIYIMHIVMLRIYGIVTRISRLSFLEHLWLVEYVFIIIGASILVLILNYLKTTLRNEENKCGVKN